MANEIKPYGSLKFVTKVAMNEQERQQQAIDIFERVNNVTFKTLDEISQIHKQMGLIVSTDDPDQNYYYFFNAVTSNYEKGNIFSPQGISDGGIITKMIADGAVTPEKTSFLDNISNNIFNYKNDTYYSLTNCTAEVVADGLHCIGNTPESGGQLGFSRGYFKFNNLKPNTKYYLSFNVKIHKQGFNERMGVFVKESQKQFIFPNDNERITKELTTDETANITICLNSFDIDLINIMLTEKPTFEFESYEYYKFNFLYDKNITFEDIDFIEKPNKNIFTYDNKVDGFFIADPSGKLTALSVFDTSDFIEIKPNTTYTINRCKRLLLYDVTKKSIPSTYNADFNQDYTFTTPSNAKYIRVSWKPEEFTGNIIGNPDTCYLEGIQIEEGATATSYIPKRKEFNLPIELNQEQINYLTKYYLNANRLAGKKIVFDGDSICYGAGWKGGYGKIIAENNSMKEVNVGVSGATIASGTGVSHIISTSIDKIPLDNDYVILEGGYNDYAKNVPLGTYNKNNYDVTLSNYDTSKFASAFEYMLIKLLTRFVGKKIGFIIIHRVHPVNENLNKYLDIEVELLNKWSIPFIDLRNELGYNTAISDEFNKLYFQDKSDGSAGALHPNEKGYRELYVPKIEAWLKTL